MPGVPGVRGCGGCEGEWLRAIECIRGCIRVIDVCAGESIGREKRGWRSRGSRGRRGGGEGSVGGRGGEGGVCVVDEEVLHPHCSVVLYPLNKQRLLMLSLCDVVWCGEVT
jgi:hypothetical protein